MTPQYSNRVSVSQPFTMLVAHRERASDPSKGESGNPTVIRTGFKTQVITTQNGVGVLGNFTSKKVHLIIKVNTAYYGNTRLGNAPPFYSQDRIQAYASSLNGLDQVPPLKAGEDFGQAQGEAAGNAAALTAIAASLATALNDLDLGIKASVNLVDDTKVEVQTDSIEDSLILNLISFSYKLLAGAPPFVIQDAEGNTIYDPDTDDLASKTLVIRSKDIDPISEIA